MKKSDLKPGEEYALGGLSQYDPKKRATFVGFEEPIRVPAGWQGKEEAEVRGMVFELHADERPWSFAPGQMKNGNPDGRRVLTPTAKHAIMPWPEWAAKLARDEAAKEDALAERARRNGVLVEGVNALRDLFGFDVRVLDKDYGSGVEFSSAGVTLDPDALAALLDRIGGPRPEAGSIPLALTGSASRSLVFAERAAKQLDLDELPEHELHRLASIAGEAKRRAEELRVRFADAEQRVKTGEPF